jgi:hypothetical protein
MRTLSLDCLTLSELPPAETIRVAADAGYSSVSVWDHAIEGSVRRDRARSRQGLEAQDRFVDGDLRRGRNARAGLRHAVDVGLDLDRHATRTPGSEERRDEEREARPEPDRKHRGQSDERTGHACEGTELGDTMVSGREQLHAAGRDQNRPKHAGRDRDEPRGGDGGRDPDDPGGESRDRPGRESRLIEHEGSPDCGAREGR